MTLAHPMAVLPLRGWGLPTTALVIGSMVPDIPVFVNWSWGYELSHRLLGLVTFDLLVATVVVAVWYFAIRDAVADMAPAPIRTRLRPRLRPTRREWLLTPPAVVVGSATHQLWDCFTHVGRWGPRHIDWLAEEHGPLLGLKWAQYTSGVVGLTVVTIVAIGFLRSLDPLPDLRRPPVLPSVVLPAVIAASVLVGLVAAARHSAYGFIDMAFFGVVRSLITLTVLGALACVSWHAAHRASAVREAGRTGP
jgi:hypothetical protein